MGPQNREVRFAVTYVCVLRVCAGECVLCVHVC